MNYDFNSIAGYEREKEELKKLCDIFNNREVYEQKGAKLPKGVIFYGRTGTGKTLFSKVLANVCGLKTYTIDLGNVDNETAICRKIRKAFASAAKRKQPSMIFFDEIDKVVPDVEERVISDRSKTVLAQLLTLIDGMDSSGNIVFVATCNNYANLPSTLVRPGRIDKKINIGIPTYASRVEILRMYMQRSSCKFEMTVEEIAKQCIGLSCSALETLVNECILHSSEDGFVSQKLVYEKIHEIKDEDIPRNSSQKMDAIDACRNIGAFIVAKNFNDGDYVLNLEDDTVCNEYFNNLINDYDDDYEYDDDDDYDEDDESESRTCQVKYFSKQDFLNAACALLGGYVAEEIVFNKVYDNVKGRLITMEYVIFGMSYTGIMGVNMRFSYLRRNNISYKQSFIDSLNDEFDRIIQTCYQTAQKILQANAEVLNKLIPILVKARSLDKNSCERILKELGGITVVNA